MSKHTIIRRTVAAALVAGGVAAITPVAAQAKNPPPAPASFTMAACPLAGASDGSGTVSGLTYSVNVKAKPNTTYEVRARFSILPKGATTRVFGKAKDTVVTTDATGLVAKSGTLTDPTSVIYRVDLVDALGELLAATSDGIAGCD